MMEALPLKASCNRRDKEKIDCKGLERVGA